MGNRRANIVVNCNVKVDKLEQNAKNNIVLKYTNEQEVEYTDRGMEETEINYIVRKEIKEEVNQAMEAPVEPVSTTDPIIVTKNISAGNNKDIYEAQVQKYTITVKNNTASDMQNIVVEDVFRKRWYMLMRLIQTVFITIILKMRV